jgi:hypothetical protein
LRPGLAKARPAALIAVRFARLARTTDARWRELFAKADTLSEGAVREEREGATWFGSTSLILVAPPDLEPEARRLFAAIAARDPHVRLRAIRTAYREATLRAPGPLGASVCEIRVTKDSRGVRIDVDVQAPLIGERRRGAAQV